nr:polysaccharide biosynthesis C-terminal domain-containing protein [Desulfosarcina alkanivorans]
MSFLWIGTISGAGFVFIAQVIFARALTPFDYGILASSLVAVTMLGAIASFGIGPFWLKIFGEKGWSGKEWLKSSLRIVVISCLTACGLLFTYSSIDRSGNGFSLIWWLTPMIGMFAVVDLVSARLQLEERYVTLTLWLMLPQAGRLIVALMAMFSGGALYIVGGGFLGVAITIMAIGAPLIAGMFKANFNLVGHNKEIQIGLPSPRVRDVFAGAWPFAIAGIFYLIYFQSDILLLKWMRGPEIAGLYNVAYATMAAVYMLPGVVYQKYLLHKQHRWAEHDRQQFLAVFRFGCGVMLTTGLIVMVVVLMLAPWAVPLLFGKVYSEAGRIVLVLAVCVPLRFLATSVGGTLVTQDHMRHKVCYMGVAAAVNILLNIILIPLFSYYGAAAATVASETVILCAYLLAVKKRVFGNEAWRGWTLRYRKIGNDG